jgi:hypothetical protein
MLGGSVGVFVIAELCCGVMQRLDLATKVQLGPKLPPAAKSYLCDSFS